MAVRMLVKTRLRNDDRVRHLERVGHREVLVERYADEKREFGIQDALGGLQTLPIGMGRPHASAEVTEAGRIGTRHDRILAPLRRLATATPTPHRSSRQVSPVGASAAPLPSPPTPPPSPPSPPPAPAVAPAPAPVTVAQATTDKGKPPKDGSKPGWGNGDPNHDHTGPPGKQSKNQATSPGPPEPAAAASDQHGSDQNGEKKSTVR